MISRVSSFAERHAPALVGAMAFGVYAALAPAVCGDRDASELTLALATGGVPHPTGYPLYVLLGHAFVNALRACGASAPYAANLWSALGAAVAVAMLVALARRLVYPHAPSRGLRLAVTLLPAAVLLFHPVWAAAATVAEVHSWHVAWVLATVFASVNVVTNPPRSVLGLGAYGLLCGLGLAHHATATLILTPIGIAFLVAARGARLTKRHWASLIVASHLPALAYVWVAWRAAHPAAFQWPPLTEDPVSILSHIAGGTYGRYFGSFAPSPGQRLLLARSVYPLLAIILPALLVLVGVRRVCPNRRVAWIVTGCALLPLLHAFTYGVDDPASYFLPTLALGCAALAPLTAALCQTAAARPVQRLAPVAFGLLALGIAVPGAHEATLRRVYHERFDQRVRALWRSLPADSAIVFWRSDGFWRLRAYQILDGERPDLYVDLSLNLVSEGPRWSFADRFGFDPLAGIDLDAALPLEVLTADIEANVASLSTVPVFDFRPGDDRVDWIGGGERDPRAPALSAASGSPKPATSGAAPAR